MTRLPQPTSNASASTPRSQALIDGIMAVMEAAFDPEYGEAWNRRQINDALVLPNTHAVLIDENGDDFSSLSKGQPTGFVLSRQAADEEELLLLAVTPGHRTRGLGRRLVERLFEAAATRGVHRIFLEMRRGNPAIHLYQSVGFEPIGERPNYYKRLDGQRIDAITFARAL